MKPLPPTLDVSAEEFKLFALDSLSTLTGFTMVRKYVELTPVYQLLKKSPGIL